MLIYLYYIKSILNERKDLLETFIEMLGYSINKPFECVGTYEEARLAVSKAINNKEQGYLLDYYREHYPLELDSSKIEAYNEENHLGEYYNNIVKEELNHYV